MTEATVNILALGDICDKPAEQAVAITGVRTNIILNACDQRVRTD